jgi:hypothetical protein
MDRSMTIGRVHCQTMRARVRSLLVVLAAGTGLGATAAPASAASGYCSPTGDYCYSARAERGVVRLRLSTFSFSGDVEVCVSHRRGRACHRFALRRNRHDVYAFAVRWSRSFPNHGHGTYRVRFRVPGTPSALGPGATFRR